MTHKKILLAIDDMITQLDIYRVILSYQYNVIACESAIKAIDILKEKKVDIILSDIEMPEMTGLEFLREIRQKPYLKEIPVIIISSYQDITDALNCGANDYIIKPVEPIALQEKIKKLLT
jgi:CheY-like chemotaxis protein